MELIKTADVVLENLPPGTLERFGLGSEAIRAANPSVLMVSSQTMGRHGAVVAIGGVMAPTPNCRAE